MGMCLLDTDGEVPGRGSRAASTTACARQSPSTEYRRKLALAAAFTFRLPAPDPDGPAGSNKENRVARSVFCCCV